MEEIINCAAYAEGRRVANVELKNAGEILRQTNGFVWIGLHEPKEETLQLVQKEFGLHELAIEDAHRAHQRPKVEIYGNSVFIVLRTARINKESRIEFGETHFFLGNNFIITVRHGSSISYTDVRARCAFAYHCALYCALPAFPEIGMAVEDKRKTINPQSLLFFSSLNIIPSFCSSFKTGS